MKTGAAGLEVIKSFEGWSATPYLCPADIPTIGYGSTWGMNGKRITMKHRAITKPEGDDLVRRELGHIERAIDVLITASLNQNQYDALVSFAYNLGTGNLQASTLRRKINLEDYDGAADEFPKWRKAGGRVLPGLVRRRAVERELFVS